MTFLLLHKNCHSRHPLNPIIMQGVFQAISHHYVRIYIYTYAHFRICHQPRCPRNSQIVSYINWLEKISSQSLEFMSCLDINLLLPNTLIVFLFTSFFVQCPTFQLVMPARRESRWGYFFYPHKTRLDGVSTKNINLRRWKRKKPIQFGHKPSKFIFSLLRHSDCRWVHFKFGDCTKACSTEIVVTKETFPWYKSSKSVCPLTWINGLDLRAVLREPFRGNVGSMLK